MLLTPTDKWFTGQLVVPNHGPVLHPRGNVLDLPEEAGAWLLGEGYAVEMAAADVPDQVRIVPGQSNCDPSGGIQVARPDPTAWAVTPEVIPVPLAVVGAIGTAAEGTVDETGEAETGEEANTGAASTTEDSPDDALWQAVVVDFLNAPTTKADLPNDDPGVKGIGPKLFAKLVKLKDTQPVLTWAIVRAALTDNQYNTVRDWAIAKLSE